MNNYQNPTSHSEHLDENELAQYADYLRFESGEITDKMIDHVASCSYCRAELMAITDLLDQLPDIAEELADAVESHPVSDPGYILPVAGRGRMAGYKWLRAVAAVAALVLITWGIERLIPDHTGRHPVAMNGIQNTTHPRDSIAQNRPINNPQTTNLSIEDPLASKNGTPGSYSISGFISDTVRYASAYVPSPMYEGLLGAKYRAGTNPKVSGPAVGSVFAPGDTLKISWIPDPEDPYIILIFDNKGNPVKEIRPGMSTSLAMKLDFKPGLYYWKFTGKEEFWYVGIFKVIGTK